MNWKIILVTAALAAKRKKDSISFARPRMPDRVAYEDFLPVNESFIFEIECSKMDNASCEYARRELNRVGEWIATDILLRVPIKVSVAFEPIYGGNLYDMETKAPIAARKAGDESGQMLLYEATLMNQIDLTDKIPFDVFRRIQSFKPPDEIETDIKLRFINSSQIWNFAAVNSSASNSTSTRNYPDFKRNSL